jgi:SAM-dependent methyltransferase
MEKAFERASCDLCGCSDQTLLFTKKDTTSYWRAKCAEDASIDVETEFPVVRCKRCNHVYVSPRLKPEVNADIYARFWSSYEPEELLHDDFAVYLCRQLAGMTRLGRLLDFGCGWGNFLSAARETGWDAVGIEVDPAKIDFARKHGLNAVQGDLLAGTFPAGSFDAIIAQQVFEHLYQPAAYLEEIRRLLRPGGIVFIGVPNYGGLSAKLKGPDWDMISPVAHVRYFTARTMSRFLNQHGLVPVRKRYLRRFRHSILRELVYQSIVFVENEAGLYPHTLSMYARKR